MKKIKPKKLGDINDHLSDKENIVDNDDEIKRKLK